MPNSLKVVWSYDAGESIESSAAIVGSTVFVGSQKGELTALNLDNGAVYWKYTIDSPIGESSPAYSNGVVYVGDLGGWLHAVNATDGKKIWAFKAGNEIKSSPVVLGDRVLIGSYDQNLYCVSTAQRFTPLEGENQRPCAFHSECFRRRCLHRRMR